ncbi:hypothetical protein Tco_0070213 [Tanacetum coccineum]
MADLKYRDEHNKVGFLEKPKGSADYHQVLDFFKEFTYQPPLIEPPILSLNHWFGVNFYLGMDNMGYPTEGKLTFHKNKFSPQWRFIVHTIMHCLSTKSGSWDQFGSSLATALICLTEGRKFNCKMFANMRLNFHGDTMPLLATMLPPAQPAIAGEGSGAAEPTIPDTVPETLTEPAHSHDQALIAVYLYYRIYHKNIILLKE